MKKNLKKKFALLENIRILNILSEKKYKDMKKIIDSTKDLEKNKNEISYSIFEKFLIFTGIDIEAYFKKNNLYIKTKNGNENENDYNSIYKIIYNFENFKDYYKKLAFELPNELIHFKEGFLIRY